jgi:arginine decarboxylase
MGSCSETPASWTAIALSDSSQREAPLAAAVDRVLAASDIFPFTTPGHKRSARLADPLLALDLPLATGADDGHLSGGVLLRAEALAAELWGAERCRFSVNGSTHCNQALALAVGRPGDRVIVARNLHKSLLMGLVFAGLEPVWVYPSVDPVTGLALTVTPAEIERAIGEAPDARAVFLVEPSFFGVVGDIARAAGSAHAAGIPVIVDQAWGSHLGFHPDVPPTALSQGADAQVVSTHKTLAAFTQSALLLARSGFLDLDRLDEAFDALNTTSPSAAIYGSVDRMRKRMAGDGEALVGEAVRLARRAQRAFAEIDGVEVFSDRVARDHRHLAYDPTKLVISLAGTGADGLGVERDIWEAGVRLELADRDTLVPLVTVGDDDRAIDRLVGSIAASIAGRRTEPRPPSREDFTGFRLETVTTPRDAFFSDRETVSAGAAHGRIAAEVVAPYPPGIPVIAPGERIEAQVVAALQDEARRGTRIAYCRSPTLEAIQVIRDG